MSEGLDERGSETKKGSNKETGRKVRERRERVVIKRGREREKKKEHDEDKPVE